MVGIVQFYTGQDIFVTGATGYIGKALIEKILRFCPDVGNIYVLVRPKRGNDAARRVREMLQLPLYDLLRRDNPQSFSKVIPVAGDTSELGLGMADVDRKLIEDHVSIVFNVAATVRFDEALKKAILLNTRGIREIMMMARNMKKLKGLVHVSTAYCNCDRQDVEEKIYPPHADWKQMIQLAESYDENLLSILTPKILDTLPNTYTFTKSLAEHVVKDLGENLPVVIFRPSIVVPTHYEPFPGWADSFSGPLGFLVAAATGLMRIGYGDPHLKTDYIPLDSVVNLMILAAKAASRNAKEVPVYNASSHNLRRQSILEFMDSSRDAISEIPLTRMIWLPKGQSTTIWLWYYVSILFTHLLPALVMDGIIKLSGNEPILCKIQRKIYTSNDALYLFTNNNWNFPNTKCLALRSEVKPEEKEHFKHLFNLENYNPISYIKIIAAGVRRYLLKESDDTIPRGKILYVRLWWLDRSARVGIAILCTWLMSHYTWTYAFLSCFIALMVFT